MIIQLKVHFKSRGNLSFGRKDEMMLYAVGEAAKRIGVAPSTLRYYDKEGLLPFVDRSSGGIRMFKEEDFSWLEIIECLKQTGMSIKEIKEFMDWCMKGDATIDKRLALINRQKKIVEEQIEKLKATSHLLEYKQWYYKTAQEAGTCAVHDTMPTEDIPKEFQDIARRIHMWDKADT